MVVIDLGYKSVVLPADKALQLVQILEKAEVYEHKYWTTDKRKEKGISNDYTHHVYELDHGFNMKVITDDLYNMAKLAGKPEKD